MVAPPPVTPVTIPVADPMVIVELVLLHIPPGVMSLKVVVAPMQISVPPVIAAGSGFTVTNVVTVQPTPRE
jgi:hypothetical protein